MPGRVEGRKFVWSVEDPIGDPVEVVIPLRFRYGLAMRQQAGEISEADVMAELIPDQLGVVADMDALEVARMVGGWDAAYRARQGVGVGEASGSSV